MELAKHFFQAAQHHPRFVFVFGHPGVGKSQFARTLFWDLRHECAHHAQHFVQCERIAPNPPEVAIRQLHQIANGIFSLPPETPQIVWLDEFDMLAPEPPPDRASRDLVTSWGIMIVRQIADRGLPALVLAATNYPHALDSAIKNEICLSIYFEPPSASVLEAIAAEKLGLDSNGARQVVACYLELASKDREPKKVMTRPFVKAIDAFLDLFPHWSPQHGIDPEALAEDLGIARQPFVHEFETWQERERDWIQTSKRLKALFRRATTGGQS